jgi:hypothetical protein
MTTPSTVTLRMSLGLVVALLGVTAHSIAPAISDTVQPAPGTWIVTGSLNSARKSHTATLLPNGKVLVAGDNSGAVVLDSAELYDPSTGTWSDAGRMNVARSERTATLLNNGKVLICGGDIPAAGPPSATATAELYDPQSGL